MGIFGEARTKEDILKHEIIFLWGAGFACPMTIDCIGKERIQAVFDSDENKWGKQIAGVDIVCPDELKKYRDKDYVIVVATNGYEYEIACHIRDDLNVPEDRIFCNTNNTVEECRYVPEVIEKNTDRILAVYNMFEDEDSKEYYMNFIKACYERNPFLFKDNKSATDAYEYSTDIANVGLRGGETILDCGAFTGDTAKLFRKKTNNNCVVHCFEPVVENAGEIEKWIENENIENVFVHNVGVGEVKHMDYVYSNEEVTMLGSVGNNRFGAENPVVNSIQVDTIDNMAKDLKVDYIKMDIEGAEMAALRGGENVIKRCRPQMLISGYHKITDMWEVPEFVFSLCGDYKMFLGHQPHAPYEPEFMFVRQEEV